MLCYYYDVKHASNFEHLFGGLDIARNPTPEKNRYLILRLEFTGLSHQGATEELERSFVTRLRHRMAQFVQAYDALIPGLADAFKADDSGKTGAEPLSQLLSQLLSLVACSPYPLYVLIDEYDNFTNELVFRGKHKTYESVLHGAGFLREFYKMLKEGTGMGVIGRIFLTGVSPLTLDDLGSGANMFSYPFLKEEWQAMTGFTEDEVRSLVQPRLQELALEHRLDETMDLLRFYYNGYRFSADGAIPCFNPDMVLYFLHELKPDGRFPRYMLDQNLRMDYGKLRALMMGTGNTPRADAVQKLLTVVEKGEIDGSVEQLFPITKAWEPELFTSQLFYHGLVTHHSEEPSRKLAIPNFVIRELLWENLRGMLGDVFDAQVTSTRLDSALDGLARLGDPLPFLRVIQAELFPKLSNRDLIKFRESSVKMLILACLSFRNFLLIFSELERIGGYSDLILVPNPNFPWARACVLLELKYVKLADWAAKQLTVVETRMQEGEAQLEKYAHDPRLAAFQGSRWTKMTIVFVGRQAIYHRVPGQATQTLTPEPEEDPE